MRRRAWIVIVVLAVAMLALLPSAAAGAKGGKPQPQPKITCHEWGTGWVLGSYNEVGGYYSASGLPTCIDLLDIHTGPMRWTVSWTGQTLRPIKGLTIHFEVWGAGGRTVLGENHIAYTTSGSYDFGVLDPSDPGFKLVVMPFSRDVWTSFAVTLTPTLP